MYTAEQSMFYPTFEFGKRNVGRKTLVTSGWTADTRPYRSGDLMPGDVCTIGDSPTKLVCREDNGTLVLVPQVSY